MSLGVKLSKLLQYEGSRRRVFGLKINTLWESRLY